MNIESRYFQESLKHDFITFQKIVKLAWHIINELEQWLKIPPRWEVHIIYLLECFFEIDVIDGYQIHDFYDWNIDIPWVVFIILESFLWASFVNDEENSTSIELLQRSVVFWYYKRLWRLLGKNINHDFDNNFWRSLITNQRSVSEKLNTPVLEVLSILIPQSHKKWSTNFDNSHATILDDFLNILWDQGIIDEQTLIDSISTNDIDRTIYTILKNLIFWKIIPHTSYLYECFLEFETLYKKRVIHSLTQLISDEIIETLGIWINPQVFESMIHAFRYNDPDMYSSFNQSEFADLLLEENIISQKERDYIATMLEEKDFLHYTSKIFFERVVQEGLLAYDQEVQFLDCCITFQSMEWSKYFEKENLTLQLSYSLLGGILDSLRWDYTWNNLDSQTLNQLIDILEELQYPSYYLVQVIWKGYSIGPHAIWMWFDKLKELSSPFHKAIQILWVFVCDVMTASHPDFEEASELVLCNTKDAKNHAKLVKFIHEKQNPRDFGWNTRSSTLFQVRQLESHAKTAAESRETQLTKWMEEVLQILENEGIYGDSDYISQFYSFLLQSELISTQEFQKYSEVWDDIHVLFEILEQIFVRNFLGDCKEETELLDYFLVVLDKMWDTKRHTRILNILLK